MSSAPLLESIARSALRVGSLSKPAARQAARAAVADTLACMLAAASEPAVSAAAGALVDAGESGPCRVVCHPGTLAPASAALVNGVAAHIHDFDDYETAGSTHPSAVIVPALLALGEAANASLDAMLDAYIAGFEAIARTGELLGYAHYEAGWHATGTIGPIGAAAASARLLGLNAETLSHAMSLAASTSSGLKVQFGTDAKGLHAGLAARSGVTAALMARAGLTAAADLFEGETGYLRLFSGDRQLVVRASGGDTVPAAILEYGALPKPYPCCAYTHRAIEAALELSASAPADQIVSGRIEMAAPYASVVSAANPQTPNAGRFSVLYCVASALVDGRLGPASFTLDALQLEEVRALMNRLVLAPYEVSGHPGDMSPDNPDRVVLELSTGSEVDAAIAHVRGSARNPMSVDDRARKIRDCALAAARPSAGEYLLGMLTEDISRTCARRISDLCGQVLTDAGDCRG